MKLMKHEEIRKLKKNTYSLFRELTTQKSDFKFDLRVTKNIETEAPCVTVP